MSNLNNITSKILKDAEERKDSILAKAEEEKNSILSKKIAKAKEVESEMITKAEVEAKTRKERMISGAKLKVRNSKLEAKQEIISEIFDMSIEKLASMSKDEFLGFVKNTILNSTISGDENIILNKDGKALVDDAFIQDINKALGAKGNLKVSSEVRNFKGGFVLEKDGIEINNTYEALVNSLRDELQFEVAKVLFN